MQGQQEAHFLRLQEIEELSFIVNRKSIRQQAYSKQDPKVLLFLTPKLLQATIISRLSLRIMEQAALKW
jgi:hypothetical protein